MSADNQLKLETLLQSFNKLPENVDLDHVHDYCNSKIRERVAEELESIFAFDDCAGSAGSDKTVCGHVFSKGEGIYRCKTCGYDDTCVMCSKCFHASNHEGHEVFFSVSRVAGGMCDCGDSEAWKVDLNCSIHSARQKRKGPDDSIKCCDVGDLADDSEYQLISYLIDYCVFVLTLWNSTSDSPLDLTEHSKNPTEESLEMQFNYDRDDGDLDVGMILWNDEFHSYNEVIDTAVDALDCSDSDARQIADQIDKEGRMMISTSKDLKKMISQSKKFRSIGLATSFSTILGYFREQVVSYIFDFMASKCNVSQSFRNKLNSKLFSKIGNLNSFSNFARNSVESGVFEAHLSNFKVNSDMDLVEGTFLGNSDISSVLSDALSTNVLVFDLFLVYDTKNWKKLRQNCRKLLVSTVLHYKESKLFGALRFTRIYRELVKLLINSDREPDLSMIYLSVQLFTSPSVAVTIQRNTNGLLILLNALQDSLFLTSDGTDTVRLNKSFYTHIFHDIGYILTPYKDSLYSEKFRFDEIFIKKYLDFMCKFEGLDGSKREKTHHVEYESTAWRKSFELMYFMANNIKLVCEIFSNTKNNISSLFKMCIDQLVSKDADFDLHELCDFIDENKVHMLTSHKVSEAVFSFHNPLNWFMGNLIVNIWKKDTEDAGNKVSQLAEYLAPLSLSQTLRLVYEKSLITQVAISQCRAGLWVRNGWSFRGQMENYTHTFIRGETWDMELAVIQACCFLLPTDVFLLDMVDKYELSPVFDMRSGPKSDFDPEQTSYMLEELFFILLCCLTDEFILQVKTRQDEITRALIQGLGTGPLSFSEVETQVSSALFDDERFVTTLQKMASLKISDKTHENGKYEIEDQYLSQFIPFCFIQKRSKKEEARSYYKSRTSKNDSDDFFLRMRGRLEAGIFFENDSFLHMLLVGLALNVLPDFGDGVVRKPFSFQLLDLVLTTIVLCLNSASEKMQSFKTRIIVKDAMVMINIVDLCISIYENVEYEQFHHMALYIIGKISPDYLKKEPESNEKDQISIQDKHKKEAALKRKAKLLEQFAAQQTTFAEANENILDEMEMESEIENDLIGSGTCIICQETLYRDSKDEYGLVASSQYSKYIRCSPPISELILNTINVEIDSWHRSEAESRTDIAIPGCFISSCGHFMHVKCHELFVKQQRLQRARGVFSEDNKAEFACPLCKSFHNVLLPILPTTNVSNSDSNYENWSFSEFLNHVNEVSKSLDTEDIIDELGRIGKFSRNIERCVVSQPGETTWTSSLQSELERKLIAQCSDKATMEEIEECNEKFEMDMDISPPLALFQLNTAYVKEGEYSLWQALTYTLQTMVSSGEEIVNDKTIIALTELLGHSDFIQPKSALKAILDTIAGDQSSENLEELPHAVGDPLELVIALASYEEGRQLLKSSHMMSWMCIASMSRMLSELFRLGSFVAKENPKIQTELDEVHLFADKLIDAHFDRLKQTSSRTDEWNDLVQMKKQTVFAIPAAELKKLATLELENLGSCLDILQAHSREFLPKCWNSQTLRNASEEVSKKFAEPETISCAVDIIRELTDACCNQYTFGELEKVAELFRILKLENIPTWYWNHVFSFPIWPRKIHDYSLIDLPECYQEVLEKALESSCLKCGMKLFDPILCLICGKYLCSGQSCCEASAQTPDEHMSSCCGEVGLFLMVKKCRVLLIHKDKVVVYNAPYLDKHGETDINLRRGAPQYLHRKRYEMIQKLWIKQQIASTIRRKTDQQ